MGKKYHTPTLRNKMSLCFSQIATEPDATNFTIIWKLAEKTRRRAKKFRYVENKQK